MKKSNTFDKYKLWHSFMSFIYCYLSHWCQPSDIDPYLSSKEKFFVYLYCEPIPELKYFYFIWEFNQRTSHSCQRHAKSCSSFLFFACFLLSDGMAKHAFNSVQFLLLSWVELKATEIYSNFSMKCYSWWGRVCSPTKFS